MIGYLLFVLFFSLVMLKLFIENLVIIILVDYCFFLLVNGVVDLFEDFEDSWYWVCIQFLVIFQCCCFGYQFDFLWFIFYGGFVGGYVVVQFVLLYFDDVLVVVFMYLFVDLQDYIFIIGLREDEVMVFCVLLEEMFLREEVLIWIEDKW